MLARIADALRGLRVELDLETVAAEGSVPHDPQTNGAAEVAVKPVKASFRANQLTLERRLQTQIPPNHPVLTWLIRHSAILRTMRQVGRDGRTGYERARGAPCSSKLPGFGEVCRYKCRSHERAIPGTSQRWATGMWMGIDLRTGQYILWNSQLKSIQYSRTLFRSPEVENGIVTFSALL